MQDYTCHIERDKIEHLALGDAATPFGLMKFRLTYDGKLPSINPRKSWKPTEWEIRAQISNQLAELYKIHPVLSREPRIAMWTNEGTGSRQTYVERFRQPINVGGHNCIPLVRESLALSCTLDVLFLRQQAAGSLITGGDIDNRIQLLFDALKMPDRSDLDSGMPDNVPSHYLLENDSLITGVSVQTDRLLVPKTANINHSLLLIDVTVRVMQITPWNVGFLRVRPGTL
jgi:hypothetical protein